MAALWPLTPDSPFVGGLARLAVPLAPSAAALDEAALAASSSSSSSSSSSASSASSAASSASAVPYRVFAELLMRHSHHEALRGVLVAFAVGVVPAAADSERDV